MIVLKTCPCCDGVARMVCYPAGKTSYHEYFTDRYAVQCEYTGMDKGCGNESGHYKTPEEAGETWNRRDGMP